MDYSSVGCVFAELFLEGKPLFTLGELLKYREREMKFDTQLGAWRTRASGYVHAFHYCVRRRLIKQMIANHPATRPSFDTLLHMSRGTSSPRKAGPNASPSAAE